MDDRLVESCELNKGQRDTPGDCADRASRSAAQELRWGLLAPLAHGAVNEQGSGSEEQGRRGLGDRIRGRLVLATGTVSVGSGAVAATPAPASFCVQTHE